MDDIEGIASKNRLIGRLEIILWISCILFAWFIGILISGWISVYLYM